METRANHVMIGAFALAVTVLAFAFVLWLAKVQVTAQYGYYLVKFTDGVSGLPLGGEVRYNGVKVGTVESIHFAPKEPSAVYVLIKVENRPDFSLREDSEASLQFQGITGITYVMITGGTLDSAKLPLVTDPKGDVPVIVAQPSPIAQVFDTFPELVDKARQTFDRINSILDKNNQERINEIIANLATGSQNFSDAIKSIDKLSTDTDSLVDGDAKTSVQQLAQASKSIEQAAALSSQILTENKAAINQFTDQGLAQITSFTTEARRLVETLDRIAQHIESNPTGFVLNGTPAKEMAVPK